MSGTTCTRCGRPGAPITQWKFRYTREAAAFAAERGWDEDGWAAWVLETVLPLLVSEVNRKYGYKLGRDPAVVGWGVRMTRAALRD